MKIQVLFFASLKDHFGVDSQSLIFDEPVSVRQVVEILRVDAFPLLFAINESYVDGSAILKDGDDLALLMPVSGGA